MELNISGRFGVEIRDAATQQLLRTREVPNTISVDGIRQIALWLGRQQFPDNPVDSRQGYATLVWDEFKRITMVDDNLIEDPSSDVVLTGVFDNSEITFTQNYRAYNNASFCAAYEFANPVDLKGLNFICAWSGNSNEPSHNDRGGVNHLFVKYAGVNMSGAGDDFVNCDYVTRFEEHNGEKSYLSPSGYYMFATASGTWRISDTIDGSAIYESDIASTPYSGTWHAESGTEPAPSGHKGTSQWVAPFLADRSNTGGRTLNWNGSATYDFTSDDKNNSLWRGKAAQFLSFEGNINQFPAYHKLYGFLPEVEGIKLWSRSGYPTDGSWGGYFRIFTIDVYAANMHPQNPYALKLGSDDGSLLPLASGNAGLGAFVSGMEWKCTGIVQPSGYTVRFFKTLNATEANGVEFNEIGLFMNASGHLASYLAEPTLANATNLFARGIFDSGWTKDSSQSATIYYDITVS